MTPEQAWWFDTLMKGELPPLPLGTKEAGVCLREALFEQYIRHARIQGVSHRAIETRIGIFLGKQLSAKLQGRQPLVDNHQVRCYKLPPLKDCRKLFSEKLGQPVDWGAADWEKEEWHQGTSMRLMWSDGSAL